MKGLMCGLCGDFRALDPVPSTWVECRCGALKGHWKDPLRGIAEFEARDRRRAFVLGLNNQLLTPALEGKLAMFSDFQAAHKLATVAPNHVFDASRCGCWAVVFQIGATNDTSFVENEVEKKVREARESLELKTVPRTDEERKDDPFDERRGSGY